MERVHRAQFFQTTRFFQKLYQYLIMEKLAGSFNILILSLFYGLILFQQYLNFLEIFQMKVIGFQMKRELNRLDMSLFKSLRTLVGILLGSTIL